MAASKPAVKMVPAGLVTALSATAVGGLAQCRQPFGQPL